MSAQVALEHETGQPADWCGHPRQFWMLLAVTVGMNFGFYGFRAYIAPYIAQTFYSGLGQAAAQSHSDLLTSGLLALMYATPIVGGYLADKVLGEAVSLLLSLWLSALALVLMALPTLFGFEIGMAAFALSSGLNVPLPVLIGRNYDSSDPRRQGGYMLFYLAVNLGSFIAPFICADWVAGRWGYRMGFVAAAVGMALAAVVLQLRHHKLRPVLPRVGEGPRTRAVLAVLAGMAVLLVPTALLLSYPGVLRAAMYVLMGLLVLYFVASCIRRRDRVQTQRYLALLLLFIALVLFWTLSFQGVTSLNFFARDYVNAPFDYTLFQSANPLYILLFAPLLAVLWPWLGRRGKDPSTPRKFGIGLLLVALSYGLTAWAIRYGAAPDGKVGWGVLAGCYWLQTLGELAINPIGYSLIGLLAAPEDASFAMGGWYFGFALAYQLAGWIATLTTSGAQTGIAAYAHVYWELFIAGIAVSIVYLLAAPKLQKLMHGVH
ncbi:MAG TPA: oligopeptide:H+ symporter [Steroidobacteraceae bacterium]|nr:oligopeptide:H+ symporter [Steroidobacteraceae bacterium]